MQKKIPEISYFTRMPHISEHMHEDDSENFEILNDGKQFYDKNRANSKLRIQ